MGRAQRIKSHEIDEDLDFERRQWVVQRVSWVIVVLILVAGFAGVFGVGPLSYTQTTVGPMTVEYQRFIRNLAPTELHLRVDQSAAVDGQIHIWLDQSFVDEFEIQEVNPEPVAMESGPDRVVYQFAVAESNPVAEIAFDLEPNEPGPSHSQIGVLDGPEVDFDQFVYP